MKVLLNENSYYKFILERVNLSSFEIQETLSPDIFDENEIMLPEVREVLLQVGNDFFEFLGTSWVDLYDIILTGSLANYNWSSFSDVDLHVVIPFKQISKNSDLVDEFTWTKKELWNEEHDIKIKDYEIELYAQDTVDDLVAGGVYSVLNNKWLVKPEHKEVEMDEYRIGRIVEYFEDKMNDIYKKYIAGNTYGLIGDIGDFRDMLSNLRKKGLASGGEFSSENIAFKALRRMGVLDKLSDMKSEIYDDSMTIEKSRSEKVDDGDYVPRGDKQKSQANKDKGGDEADDGDKGAGVPQWEVNGQKFVSVRDAAKATGVPKSTVAYRADSDNFPSWKNLTKK